jgi:hypothetical protein
MSFKTGPQNPRLHNLFSTELSARLSSAQHWIGHIGHASCMDRLPLGANSGYGLGG